jgi:hypothetical protein
VFGVGEGGGKHRRGGLHGGAATGEVEVDGAQRVPPPADSPLQQRDPLVRRCGVHARGQVQLQSDECPEGDRNRRLPSPVVHVGLDALPQDGVGNIPREGLQRGPASGPGGGGGGPTILL